MRVTPTVETETIVPGIVLLEDRFLFDVVAVSKEIIFEGSL